MTTPNTSDAELYGTASADGEPTPGYRPAYAAPAANGTVAWAMGFLAYIPIPFLGSIVTGIVMALVGRAQRGKGEVARLNGRNAANWGLTYLLLTVLLPGVAFLTLALSTGPDGTVPGDSPAGIVAATSILIWAFPLQILHLVLVIVGTVKSAKGTVFRTRFALPLLK
ncbi:DUF4870 domain-containing protein [Amnibacterium flavum]|uniref:DUF4870 domain-containing protein n=1 Tax=Amnibacterium flavum TaxID=2173173 RepID=A0A2V1HRD0_9MICO|nr:DUF4870 domain-containing protein [Amnibacterium flavum]PVZ94212.1 hypothetical protein DDQ50_10740 [Amnibacterium flavum]